MKVIAFFLLALLGTSYASQAHTKALDRIYKDPTGAAIISMISLNLKLKGPIADVGAELDLIRDEYLAQSQQFEADTASENDRLTNAIANDQALDASYQNAAQSLQDTIDNAQSSLSDAQNNLSNQQQQLADTQQNVQDRDAEAAVRIPQYDQDLSDFSDAIDAVQQAIQKMNTYKQSSEGSALFIQMSTGIKEQIKKATETMQAMRKKLSKHSNMFTPLIRELIDLSSVLDQSKADEVIDLLSQLLGYLNQGASDEQSAKASYVSDYQQKQQDNADAIANYEAIIDQLEQTIDGLTSKIAQAQSDLAATQQNIADNQAKLAADQGALEALEADYAVRRTRYDNLIALVREIIDYYQQNLAVLDDYAASKVDLYQ